MSEPVPLGAGMADDHPGEPHPDEIVFTGFAVVLPRSGGNEEEPDGNELPEL